MKIFDFFDLDIRKQNQSKFRKIKLLICSLFLVMSFTTIGYRTISLASINKKNISSIAYKGIENNSFQKSLRGNIYDRNKKILATSISTLNLNINPQEILNINQTITKLIKIFPRLKKEDLFEKLNSNKKHVNLLREISPREYVSLLNAGIEGLKIESKNKRIYPNNTLASHILGATDIDGKGIAGVEKKFDNQLQNGSDVTLSIHAGIQHITRTLLLDQIKRFEAKGGAGIIMNAKSGELLSIVSLPDYNANNYNSILNENLFNKATKGTYELGSTLKLITAAIAFESNLINENDVFDVSKPLKVSSKIINDFHPLNYAINIPEVIVHSSNIGSAKIAEKFGSSTQLKYLRSLGLMNKLSLEIPELGKPQVLMDKKVLSTMTISYGHGISITPMHLTSATGTIVNNGVKVEPTLIKGKAQKKNELIISKETSIKMKSIMRLVVSNKNGTAKKAEAPGYLIGGKTGTAEKINPSGGYLKKENIVAFTGAFPMNDPKFILTIMIDNPKGQKFSYGYRTAGWVVAPVVKQLVTRVAPILGIKPQLESSTKFSKKLLDFKIRGKNHGANL
ncbi:MAG: cell division protein FtsI [Rhodospirillaceae bacterium]|nr:cell division protein FtsI [Rhodospirillaceae bacterium]